ELPNLGEVSVLTNDQALEIGYVVANDLMAKKSANDVLSSAGKTFLREKVVSIILWLINQSNVESLLPNSLTRSGFYNILRTEVARYSIDNLFNRATINK